MLKFLPTLALVALLPVSSAKYFSNQPGDSNLTTFNSPTLTPFIHANLKADFPANVSTIFGITARFPNRGGNFTGAIKGDVLPVGAATEVLPPAANGTVSLLTNTWVLNTTAGTTILMDARSTITYANKALHGFGSISFSTDAPEYLDLNWGSYIGVVESNFESGEATLDVFRLVDGGHRDGSPVLALLPPGAGAVE